MDWLISYFQNWNFDYQAFLDLAGSDPFSAMWYLFIRGGWILILWALLWGAANLWQGYIGGKAAGQKEWVLLKVSVPRTSEQTARAAENMFISFAGGHSSASWTDAWIRGFKQSTISMEIVSTEGSVAFYIRAERKLRDLVEGSVYAQYPEAELQEVEDYVKFAPHHFPDEEWTIWGTEMVPVTNDAYPLKTYHDFEDKISGEFKDPLAYMLELMSRLGPGEHLWYQIILTQTDHKGPRKRAEQLIKKLKGVKEEHKKTTLDHLIDIPMQVGKDVLNVALGMPADSPGKKDSKDAFPKLFALSPGERDILEAVERKTSQVGYECKIRFLYLAKKEAASRGKAVNAFIGAMKQTNTFHMQALKPELSHVGPGGALWFFKDKRNAERMTHLIHAYTGRSDWAGMPRFFLCAEELATLWHFPILLQVKAPSLQRIDAKKSEAPANLPFG